MKTTRLLKAFFLNSVRDIVRKFLAFFRSFTEEDVCALLSAYGFHALEIARLQNDRPTEQKEPSENLVELSSGKCTGQLPGPIPIGVHPDFTQGDWTTASRKKSIDNIR
jgi:hypothetical protein